MKVEEIKFNQWDNGMPDCEDERNLGNGWYKYMEGFYTGDNSSVLKQVGDMTPSSSSRNLRAVLNVGSTIYGLGLLSGNSSVYEFSGGLWLDNTPAVPGHFTDIENPFFVYHNGSIYYNNGNNIGKFNTTTDANDGDFSAIGEELKGGVSWNGNIYGWTLTNHLYKIDPDTGSAVDMITIPSEQSIVDLVPYGSLLSIICTSSTRNSNMYLWDGVTTTTFYDIVEIGKGTVAGGALLDGILTTVIGSNDILRIKQYNGSKFDTVFYYNGRENTNGQINTFLISRVKAAKNFIYFMIEGTRPNTTDQFDIFMVRYGNKISATQRSFSIYKYMNFKPTLQNSRINDFTILEDYFIDYEGVFATIADTSDYTIEEIWTGNSETFNQASILETCIYNGEDVSKRKQLKAISLQYAGLNGTGIVMKYKADNETSWTTIFTDNTVGSMSHESVNVESTGNNFPTFKEIQFRVEVTGGQTLIGGKFKYELIENIYGG